MEECEHVWSEFEFIDYCFKCHSSITKVDCLIEAALEKDRVRRQALAAEDIKISQN